MDSLQGKFLIASPRLLDGNFFKSVVLIVQHNDAGAMGLVLNKPLDVEIETAWRQVSESDCHMQGFLHQGGPCEGPLMVLHKDESLSQIEIRPGVHFTTEREAIEEIVGSSDVKLAKFFVGYAGWSAGQLENELGEGSWLTLAASGDDAFRLDDALWDDLIKQATRAAAFPFIDPKLIPPDPTVN